VVNAIIERKGARTALVTTQGFRDVYEIGRINRPESFNPRFHKHRPLVPRERVFEVPERMLADGSVRLALDEQAVRQIARILKEEGIEAVAVLCLHSYRSPQHEIRMCEILGETHPHVFDRAQLLQGNMIAGPAIIEEAASVTVVGPEDTVEVNAFGHLVMHLGVTP
jgi:N-methylhydantoinase A